MNSKNIKMFRRNLNRPFTHDELDNSMMVLNEWEFDFEYQIGNYVLFDTSAYPALITNGGLNLYRCENNHKSSEFDYPTINGNWALIGTPSQSQGGGQSINGDGYKIAQWDVGNNTIAFSYITHDYYGGKSANFSDRILYYDSEVLNWADCTLTATDRLPSMNWSGRFLYGSKNLQIDYGNGIFYDGNANMALTWQSDLRMLYDNNAMSALDWHNRLLLNVNADEVFNWNKTPRITELIVNDTTNSAMTKVESKLHLYDTTLHWELLTTPRPPKDPKNIVGWVDVYKNGVCFKMPLYQ